jgi:hypothetical protein
VIAVLIHRVCASVPPAELNKTVLSGVTVIVIPLDVTGLPVAQDRDEVISTVITSPLARVAAVYVALFNPTGVDPLYHW